MKLRIKTNLCFGIFAIAVSIILVVLTVSQVKVSTVVVEYVNGRFIPFIAAGVMFIAGLSSLLTSLIGKREDEKIIDMNIEKKVLLFFLALVAFFFVAKYISFLVASVLFGAFSLWYFKCRSIKKYVGVEIAIIIICLIFRFVLNVRFGGLWGF